MKGLETLLRLPGSQKVFCNGKLQNKIQIQKKKKKFEENWPRGDRVEVVHRCERMDGQTDDRWQELTIVLPELCSGELKKQKQKKRNR